MDSTLLKGLAVLEVIARAERGMTVAQVAADAGIMRSNAHRTLGTLVHAGFAERVTREGEPTRYRATLKLWELGNIVVRSLDIREAARPMLQSLSDQTNETIVLAVLEGFETIYIDKIDAKHPTGPYSYIGARAPGLCTAIGQVMVAFGPAEAIAAIPSELPRFSPRTLTRREDLLRKLAQIRKDGFAVNQGEWREEINGIAAPIFGPHGDVVAAMSVSGPRNRLTLRALGALRPLVIDAARAVSARIAGRPGAASDRTA